MSAERHSSAMLPLELMAFIVAADSSRDMMATPFNTTAAAGPGQDFAKLFKAERDNLELAEGLYSWAGAEVEERVLRKYGKLPPQ